LQDLIEKAESNEINSIDDLDAETQRALSTPWNAAKRIKRWIQKTKRKFKKETHAEKVKKRLDEWNESHPNEDRKEQLESEELDNITSEVRVAGKAELERLIENAFEILRYLRIIETEDPQVEYDIDGINASSYEVEWSDGNFEVSTGIVVHPTFKNKR
jgi:hypothetical protein